jgi:8-oxo-dGTP diphosphatase
MKQYCLGFAFSQDRKEVLLQQKDHPAWQRGRWNGLGGHLEEGEKFVDAMAREFQEEAGIVTDPAHWEHRLVVHDRPAYEMRVYRYQSLSRVADLKQGGLEPVSWFPVAMLSAYPVIQDLHWMIPLLLDQHIHGVTEIHRIF